MKFPLITLVIFVFVNNSSAQQFKKNVANHYDEINIGKIFIANKMIDSAICHYKQAIEAFEDNGEAWSQLAKLYEKKKDFKNAISAYSEAVLKGSFPNVGMDSDDFPNEKSNPAILPFVKSLDSLKGIFYTKNYNWEFADLVKQLNGVDQFPRSFNAILNGADTIKAKEFHSIMALADTAYTLPKLIDYLDNHPFPKMSHLDFDAFGDFWIVVHHNLQYSDVNPLVRKLKNYIENAVGSGEYDLRRYIYTLDYQHLIKFGNQLYGAYKNKNKEGVYIYSAGIDSIIAVDKRRGQWHLLPLYLEQKANDLHPSPPDNYDPKIQQR